MFNRYDIMHAYAWYAMHWGPTHYSSRLSRLGVQLGNGARFEVESPEVKAIYGSIVRREHRLFIGFLRLKRRARVAVSWPGTQNMISERSWLASVGLLSAVESMVAA